MNKIFSILLLNALVLFSGFGQKVSNIKFTQENNQIAITYSLSGAKFYQYYYIEVFVSTDGGKTYYGPLKEVWGDIGVNVLDGKHKKILWDVFKEKPDFGGVIIFDVKATVNSKEVHRNYFVGYNGSNSAPFGVTLTTKKKVGYYVSCRVNHVSPLFENTSLTTSGQLVENYNETGYYLYNTTKREERLSIMAGCLIPLDCKWSVYAGTGYSKYTLLWQIDKYDYNDTYRESSWVKHKEETFSGVEVECGLHFTYKYFFLSGGIASPGLRFIEGTLSGGMFF